MKIKKKKGRLLLSSNFFFFFLFSAFHAHRLKNGPASIRRVWKPPPLDAFQNVFLDPPRRNFPFVVNTVAAARAYNTTRYYRDEHTCTRRPGRVVCAFSAPRATVIDEIVQATSDVVVFYSTRSGRHAVTLYYGLLDIKRYCLSCTTAAARGRQTKRKRD